MKRLLILCALSSSWLYCFAQFSSENGYSIPVKGVVRVLLIFAENTTTFTQNSSIAGFGKGVLPSDANDHFDPSFTPGVEPTAFLSKYFYQASFGQYIVIGDYLDHTVESACDTIQFL
jgi:hypothetical protein